MGAFCILKILKSQCYMTKKAQIYLMILCHKPLLFAKKTDTMRLTAKGRYERSYRKVKKNRE